MTTEREAIAKAIHDGPNAVLELATMMIAPHAWEDCPHQATYLADAEAVLAAGFHQEQPAPPADDEREALAVIVKRVAQKFGGPSMAEFENDPPIRKHYATAEAVLAAGFRRQEPITDAQKHADELLSYVDYCLGLPMYQNTISDFGQGAVETLRMVKRTLTKGLHSDARAASEAAKEAQE